MGADAAAAGDWRAAGVWREGGEREGKGGKEGGPRSLQHVAVVSSYSSLLHVSHS